MSYIRVMHGRRNITILELMTHQVSRALRANLIAIQLWFIFPQLAGTWCRFTRVVEALLSPNSEAFI